MLKKVSLLSLLSIGFVSQAATYDVNADFKDRLKKQAVSHGMYDIVAAAEKFEDTTPGKSILLVSPYDLSENMCLNPIALVKNNHIFFLQDVNKKLFYEMLLENRYSDEDDISRLMLADLVAHDGVEKIQAGTVVHFDAHKESSTIFCVLLFLLMYDYKEEVEGLYLDEQLVIYDFVKTFKKACYDVQFNEEDGSVIINGVEC